MALVLISIFGIFLSFLIGYLYPRKAGWSIILLIPLLGPTSFTLVPSVLLPLKINRIAFVMILGIALKMNERGISFFPLFKSKVFRMVLIFSLGYFIVTFKDRLGNTLFTFLPDIFMPFILCFLLIQNEEDLHKLVKIFSWHAAIISLLIIIEYLTHFSIGVILAGTNPTVGLNELYIGDTIIEKMRSGVYRTAGIDGYPVFTGYRLAFLFPISLWYFKKKKILGTLALTIILIGLLLLQTRASFIAIGLAILIIIVTGKKNIFPQLLFLIVICTILGLLVPSISDRAKSFWHESILPVTQGLDNPDMATRYYRIPKAIDYFLEKPFSGYGSPTFVYYNLMQTKDLPAPLIYLLSGGIFLFFFYMLMVWSMPFSVFSLSLRKRLNRIQKNFLIYMASAFVAGVLVLHFNWGERHFIIMFMLYISIYKVFIHNNINKLVFKSNKMKY